MSAFTTVVVVETKRQVEVCLQVQTNLEGELLPSGCRVAADSV